MRARARRNASLSGSAVAIARARASVELPRLAGRAGAAAEPVKRVTVATRAHRDGDVAPVARNTRRAAVARGRAACLLVDARSSSRALARAATCRAFGAGRPGGARGRRRWQGRRGRQARRLRCALRARARSLWAGPGAAGRRIAGREEREDDQRRRARGLQHAQWTRGAGPWSRAASSSRRRTPRRGRPRTPRPSSPAARSRS